MRDCQNQEAFRGFMASLGFDGIIGWRPTPTTNRIAWQSCTRISDGEQVGWLVGLDQPVPLTDWVVETARSQLELDLPEVATSPPRGGVQLVGVPVWFWLANGEPVSTTASIPNLSATLTASPGPTRISIEGTDARTGETVEPTAFECADGGRPWVEGRDDPRADGPCSHRFTTNGTFTVDATVGWTLAWTATNGQTGTLPAVERTTSFTITIQEGQSVTD